MPHAESDDQAWFNGILVFPAIIMAESRVFGVGKRSMVLANTKLGSRNVSVKSHRKKNRKKSRFVTRRVEKKGSSTMLLHKNDCKEGRNGAKIGSGINRTMRRIVGMLNRNHREVAVKAV